MKEKITRNKLDLLYELVKTSFKLKYSDSVLGFVWVLLKPFLQFTMLYLVFSQFGGNASIENFTIYLLLGIIIFSFFQDGVSAGLGALLDKAHIILKVNFDKTLAVYSALFLSIINTVANFIIILVFVIFNPIEVTPISFIYFIGIFIIESILITGLSFYLSVLTVIIRDLQHIVEVGMQLLFYASAIFYSLDIVPEQYRKFLELNPLLVIIQSARNALLHGEISHQNELAVIAGVSVVLFFTGWAFFKFQVTKIAEHF